MNLLLAIPMEFRLAGLFVLGVVLGSAANLAIYRLAWHPRAISPWFTPLPAARPRRFWDRIPIVGWIGLRREEELHGRGFWVRPMLLELAAGLGLAGLYWWEVGRQGLVPPTPNWVQVPIQLRPVPLVELHAQFACHAVLFWLMLVASFIDIDEQTIPDTITVGGTLFGLVVATAYPWSLLPAIEWIARPGALPVLQPDRTFLHLTCPHPWPNSLDGFPNGWPLAIALGCWWLWCVGLMQRTWYSRHGWRRALELFAARLVRSRANWLIFGTGLVGTAAITAVWYWGTVHWQGLLTALVGMAAGGLLIWTVRIFARLVLRREAMGFGDVTLLAMLGALLGWQSSLVIFFLAPLAGVILGILSLVLRGENVIPFGPFLSLAAAFTIVRWAGVWDFLAQPLLIFGLVIPLIVVICLVAIIPLLAIFQGIKWLVRSAMR